MTIEYSTTKIRHSRSVMRQSKSTIKDTARHSVGYRPTLDYDEEIDDALELRASVERYSSIPSQAFARLEDVED